MGQSPLLYFSHHIGMHHSEANMPEDKSSTMPYQRDSFRGFMHYYLRFLFMKLFSMDDLSRGDSIPQLYYSDVFLKLAGYFILPVVLIHSLMDDGELGSTCFC